MARKTSVNIAQRIRDVLAGGGDWTVAEVLLEIGEPYSERPYASSELIRGTRRGEYTRYERTCHVKGREVFAYAMAVQGSQAPKRGRARKAVPQAPKAQPVPPKAQPQAQAPKAAPQPPKAPPQPQPKAVPPPPPPPPEDPKIAAAREARRRIIEEDRKRQQEKIRHEAEINKVVNAKRVFQKYTKYVGSRLEEGKDAYRKAAMKYHPDRGGNAANFAELNDAWEILKKVFR